MNPSVLVDERIGTSYQVIKEVHAALAQILFLADNMDQLAPRQIELQQSTDKLNLQWRREGDVAWKNLVSILTLGQALDTSGVQFGIADVPDAKSYIRSQGLWKVLPALFSGVYGDLSGKPALFSGVYEDLSGKPVIPAAQVQSDWIATAGAAVIKNKPDIVLSAKVGAVNGVASLGADGKVPAAQLPASSGSGGAGGFMPLKITAGTTFVVPDNQQAFLRMAVTVDGILQVDGYLIEV